jgi:site-specific DNA-cytosine methylase
MHGSQRSAHRAPRAAIASKPQGQGASAALRGSTGHAARVAMQSDKGNAMRPPFQVPQELQHHMNAWGPKLRDQMIAASMPVKPTWAAADLRVATDCSGLEAPVLALQAMKINHRHVSSCEINPKKREFIKANFPETTVSSDMCRRKHGSLPSHNIYVCGFPCKPFSSLHANSQLFNEPAARPFFAMMRTLKENLPPLAVLENVIGLKSVLPLVVRRLRALRWYHLWIVEINPADMGEPVHRPRLYFVLVRHDVINNAGRRAGIDYDKSDGGVQTFLPVGIQQHRAPMASRLLPNSSSVVQEWLGRRRRPTAAMQGQGKKRRWHTDHAGLPHANVPPIAGLTPRCQSVLCILLAQAKLNALPYDTSVDLSQSLGRTRLVKGASPTITPNSQILIGGLGRLMTPVEKCLAHLVPLHSMKVPMILSDTDIADLAGNTMHMMAVVCLV